MPENIPENTLFGNGKAITSDKFTGTVHLKWLVRPSDPYNCPCVNVTFEPGCVNSWHVHPGGQILFVTQGKGRYQERGGPVYEIVPGDTVKIAPGVEHWHGAAPDSFMSHIAVETNPQAGPAVWLEAVSEEDRNAKTVPYAQK